MRKLECVDREKFCDELYKLIFESQSNSFQFVGKNGTGKEYVLENLEKKLRKKSEYTESFLIHSLEKDSAYLRIQLV